MIPSSQHICGCIHGSYLFIFPGENIQETQCIQFWTQSKHLQNIYLDLYFQYMCLPCFQTLLVIMRASYTTTHKLEISTISAI